MTQQELTPGLIEGLDTIGLTDFVIVGSVKEEEDGEARPNEQPNSPENGPTSIDDDDEDDGEEPEEDFTNTPSEQWFQLCIQKGCVRGFLSPRIPRVGHTRFADSYRGYVERAKRSSE